MKNFRVVVPALFLTLTVLAPAASRATPQQDKMKACNAQATAKGLGEGKGEERKAFMKECLGAKPSAKGKSAQQEKMKNCNKEASAKQLKGAERQAFMSTCLSN